MIKRKRVKIIFILAGTVVLLSNYKVQGDYAEKFTHRYLKKNKHLRIIFQ